MRVSIIITNRNYGRFLGRAIQSCQAQKLLEGDCEIIVVDDASTDSSRAVLDAYRENVRVIFNEERRGLPASVNVGIRVSRGQYVIRLDADDWLDRHACFVLSYFLDHNREVGFVWPDYSLHDPEERVLGRISAPQGAGVMFRKQLLVDVGLYDEGMRVHEDRDILLRCMEKRDGYHLKMPLYRYFRHGESMTDNQEETEAFRRKLLRKHGTDSVPVEGDPGLIRASEVKELRDG